MKLLLMLSTYRIHCCHHYTCHIGRLVVESSRVVRIKPFVNSVLAFRVAFHRVNLIIQRVAKQFSVSSSLSNTFAVIYYSPMVAWFLHTKKSRQFDLILHEPHLGFQQIPHLWGWHAYRNQSKQQQLF